MLLVEAPVLAPLSERAPRALDPEVPAGAAVGLLAICVAEDCCAWSAD